MAERGRRRGGRASGGARWPWVRGEGGSAERGPSEVGGAATGERVCARGAWVREAGRDRGVVQRGWPGRGQASGLGRDVGLGGVVVWVGSVEGLGGDWGASRGAVGMHVEGWERGRAAGERPSCRPRRSPSRCGAGQEYGSRKGGDKRTAAPWRTVGVVSKGVIAVADASTARRGKAGVRSAGQTREGRMGGEATLD